LSLRKMFVDGDALRRLHRHRLVRSGIGVRTTIGHRG
jgi:hypothetical protein